MPNPFRILVWVILAAIAVLLAIPTVARVTGWEPGPLAWLVAVTPYVGIACGILLVVTLLGRFWLLALIALVLFAFQLSWQVPLYVSEPHGSGHALTVMTLNLKNGEADPAAVVALVRSHKVDVLALEELTPGAVEVLHSAGLDTLLPFRFVKPEPGFTGTGLWSRTRLTDQRTLSGFVSQELIARTTTTAGTLTVAAVHPVAPGLWDHSGWEREATALTAALSRIAGPVVVAGDFNATRDQVPFQKLLGAGFVDAADQAGAGLHATYAFESRMPAVVVIDHVVVRDAPLVADSVAVVAVAGSDHAAVIVDYAPPQT